MICPTCNTSNRDDAKFCKSCGHPLQANVGATNVVSQSIAPAPYEAEVNPMGAEGVEVQEDLGMQSIGPAQVSTQANAGGNGEEIADLSSAPTQILSPERRIAYRHRWQKSEQEHQYGQPVATEQPQSEQAAEGHTVLQTASDSVDMHMPVTSPSEGVPTQSGGQGIALGINTFPQRDYASTPGTAQGQALGLRATTWSGGTQGQDIADMPTMRMMPSSEDIPIPPPPPPPSQEPSASQTDMGSTSEEATSAAAPSGLPPPPQSGEVTGTTNEGAEATTQGKSDTMQQTSPDQPVGVGDLVSHPHPVRGTGNSEASDFSPLPVGMMMLGRYEITQVTSESQQENVYQVIDRQGYQHCWNCGSEQNAEGDEFCINCGASMLNVPYVMHEYAPVGAPEAGAQDSHVLQGNIVNTFVEQGRTYMIEQPQAAHSAFPNGVHLLAAGDSDAGDVRRSEPNEDSTLILELQRVHESMASPSGVFIVADGLGGHDNGQIASRTTINIIAERMVRELLDGPLASEKEGESGKLPDEDGLVALFQGAIEDANKALVQMNQRDKTDMGSTITGFMIVGDHAYIINVGDSRTYMMRGKQLYQLTTDHSLVGQLVAGGLIEPDEIYTHPQRSQIFRSLGDKPNVQIDVFKQQLHSGDILLSCSDGLWEMVRNPQMESILNEAPDPQTACTQLIEAANTNGGEDNISAVIVVVR